MKIVNNNKKMYVKNCLLNSIIGFKFETTIQHYLVGVDANGDECLTPYYWNNLQQPLLFQVCHNWRSFYDNIQ